MCCVLRVRCTATYIDDARRDSSLKSAVLAALAAIFGTGTPLAELQRLLKADEAQTTRQPLIALLIALAAQRR